LLGFFVKDRRWLKLSFKDPLPYLTQMQGMLNKSGVFKFSNWKEILRNRKLRNIWEDRRCAIFCYGLSKTTDSKIFFSNFESSDYDYVLAIEHSNNKWFVPLQMKQLVSTEVNSSTNIQQEINKLKKYTTSQDLVVAIHINRVVEFGIEDLDLSGLNIRELWFFGHFPSDKYKWRIIGNALSPDPKELLFSLPKT
jgi:hypothetical protein